MQTKNIILQTINNNLKLILALTFTMIFSALLKVSGILIFKKVVDDINVIKSLAVWVVLFVASISFYFLFDSIRNSQINHLGNRVNHTLKKHIFSSGLRADLAELDKYEKEEFIKNINYNCEIIGTEYISKNISAFISETIFLLTVFITTMVINPVLSLVLFGTLPICFGVTKGISKITSKIHNKYSNLKTEDETRLNETFDKIRNIKLKNGVIQEEEEYYSLLDNLYKMKQKSQSYNYIYKYGIHFLLIGCITAILIGLGGLLVRQSINKTTTGDIVAFLLLTPFVYFSFSQVMKYKLSYHYIDNQIEEIDKFINIRSEIKSEPITSLEEVHSLKFVDVKYISNIESNNLDNLSFELKRGEKLGILSLSGDAKSSIFDLLTKIIRPKDGMITINNCDINKLDTFYLRSIVTAVPQDDSLFVDTIENNITYPLEFDEYQYNDALNRSGLKDFVLELENKSNTIIDSNSNFLNEDIKQRIVLANAFYKDSKIFILNDATSSLDPRSEDEIMQEIYKLKNKIIIVMSDRAYNLLNCDKIIILENSELLEYGKTEDLLQDRNSILYKQIKRAKVIKSSKVS